MQVSIKCISELLVCIYALFIYSDVVINFYIILCVSQIFIVILFNCLTFFKLKIKEQTQASYACIYLLPGHFRLVFWRLQSPQSASAFACIGSSTLYYCLLSSFIPPMIFEAPEPLTLRWASGRSLSRCTVYTLLLGKSKIVLTAHLLAKKQGSSTHRKIPFFKLSR